MEKIHNSTTVNYVYIVFLMFNMLKGLQKGQKNEAAGIFAQTYAYLGMQISNFVSALNYISQS